MRKEDKGVHFLTILIRNARLRPLRTLITLIGVAAAVGGFSILTGLGRGVEDAWNSSLVKQGTHLLAYRKGVRDLLTGTIDQRISAEINKVPGVTSVVGELLDVMTLETGASVLVRGWSADSSSWRDIELAAGRLPAPDSLHDAVVGEGLAASLDVKPGDAIHVFGAVLRVVGVARMDSLLSNNSLIMPLNGLQKLLDREGKLNALHIRIEKGHDEATLEETRCRLGALFPQFLFVPARTAAQQNELYQFWRGIAWAASLTGLGLGLLIVFNTMLVAVLERTREIGVLAALGWSRLMILSLILLESLLLSMVGGLAGIALGYLGLNLLVLHPMLRGFVAVGPSFAALGQQLLMTVLIGIGGGFLPAWRALNLNPIQALRDQ